MIGEKIELLDHGYIRLIGSMGDDLSIVRNARVSHDAEWRTGLDAGKDKRLIQFLYEHSHNTPFETVVITFEVKAPIFVFRQWHRHRTWSFNEVSARYTPLPEEFYVPKLENLGVQSDTNHQARNIGGVSPDNAHLMLDSMREHNERAFELYRMYLKDGCPRELARTVLPVATYSRMFATVNLNNLFRFLGERLADGAQYEIRVYAEAMLELAREIAPVAVSCFEEEKEA